MAWARRVLEDMDLATNRAALQLPEAPVRPHLTLLEGRVKESVLVGRALAGGHRAKAAEEELYRRYRPAVARPPAPSPGRRSSRRSRSSIAMRRRTWSRGRSFARSARSPR